uniref:Uncharacterized protein n=1 Tax=Ditylenchus dipsaci TaxID=166011 RepID=A0A915DWB1_9BILA
MDDECQMHWPNTACKRENVRVPLIQSEELVNLIRGCVCLCLTLDICCSDWNVGTSTLLPSFCKTPSFGHNSTNPECPADYECIRSIGTFSDQWNGVCCPTREISCSALPDLDQNSGWLERWYFQWIDL